MQRIDAAYQVRGEAEFVDDMPPPAQMLYAAPCGAAVAHGKILAVDPTAALAVKGVVAVLTAADIPGRNLSGTIIADWPILAQDEVCYVGQPVAVVVAKTQAIARQAAKLIQLEIEELAPILDPRVAFDRGEIIGTPRTFVLGDVDSAWDNCDLVLEGTCEIGGQEHLYLETQRSRAIPLEGRTMRVHSANQNPHAAQTTIARMLDLPEHAIEVDVKRLGGGFGGKEEQATLWASLAALGRSRAEIQARNLLQAGDVFPYGQQFGTNRVRETWQQATQSYDLPAIATRIAEYNRQHLDRKKGYALMPICFGISFTTTFLNQASALVHVYTDGSVSITTGGVEMGQGLNTKIANIAAAAFGIELGRIKIETTNTTRIANMSPSAASVTTDLNGHAVLRAIGQILDRLQAIAAHALGITDRENIAIVDERVRYQGQTTDLTWTSLITKAFLSRTNLSAHAFYATPEIGFDRDRERGHPFAYHVCGTAIIEVTLDGLRGTYSIDAVKIVHDLGRSVNKLVDRGQVEGGLAQGLGWMTIEDLRFNPKGQLMSDHLTTYKVPDIYFMPDDIAIEFLEQGDNPFGPYGSKAVGEPPLMYGIGVFFALRQAMQAFQPQGKFT